MIRSVSAFFHHKGRRAGISALILAMSGMPAAVQAQSGDSTNPMQSATSIVNPAGTDGPMRLSQPAASVSNSRYSAQPLPAFALPLPPPYIPSEFERYVQTQAKDANGQDIRRFGSNLITDPAQSSFEQDPLPSIPGNYIIKPGDEIILTIWGSVDADLRLTVDRSGSIAVPRVGTIAVSGLRYADLANTIARRTEQVFKNFQLTATLSQVRAIRVYVSGYVRRPGSITVSGLASVLNVLMRAGGPSAAGSFRDIRLSRGGHQVATFDLYDLLLNGTRDADQLVQPDDVIFIGPIGTQVALVGSVNQPAIFELKRGELLSDLLNMAGGFTAVANRGKVTIERLAERITGRVTELDLPNHLRDALMTGDLVKAYSGVAFALPQNTQNKSVHIDGEVVHPGDYVLPPGSTSTDALRVAGGFTKLAFPFGIEFTRESVRRTQQINFDRALNDLEMTMVKTQATQRSTSLEETATQSASAATNVRLLERLRQARPTGRVVMPISPEDITIPDFALENGDSITIPPRGTSVGVFGSVFNTGSFVFIPNHTTDDYLQLAGGPTRGADRPSMFLIRANGSVISAQQGSSFWRSSNNFHGAIVQPGDTIFVPEELNKSTFIQDAKDWTLILYQFGLGVAGIKSLGL